MIIGKFTANETGYAGYIKTLTLNAPLQLVVNDKKTEEKQPDFYVMSHEVEIGAAWKKVSAEAENYISISLDDPSFSASLYFSLVRLHDAEPILVWTRQKAKKTTE